MEDKTQPELKDIIEMINRYSVANRSNCCFICNFVAFDDDKPNKKYKKDVIKDGADRIFAFGDKGMLRIMLNELRDIVEDSSDKEGFVNI